VPLHGQLTTKLNQNAEPGLIDKLLELWKLQSSLQRIKNQIETTGRCRSLKTRVGFCNNEKKIVH
jgi:hypothetical protein